MTRRRRRDRYALLLHVDEAPARELAAVDAFRHAQIVPEREQIERVTEGNNPFNDGWNGRSAQWHKEVYMR